MDRLVLANWKANPAGLADAKQLFQDENEAAKQYNKIATVIMPPLVFLDKLSSMATAAQLGAQNVSSEDGGSHTGEVTADMLMRFGVTHVLVGHSERRALGDTDEMINKKINALLSSGMVPVFLVGEQEKNATIRHDILVDQLTRGLKDVSKDRATDILYVYEPSWAISDRSGGTADDPADIVTGINAIKSIVAKLFGIENPQNAIHALYGGSVNEHNAAELFAYREIEGVVVGSASLRPDGFAHLLRIAHEIA